MSDHPSKVRFTTHVGTGLPVVEKAGPRANHEAIALAECAGSGVATLVEHEDGLLTLERLTGNALSASLHRSQAADLLRCLLGILQRIHRRGWLHNDVCPNNIIVTQTGPVLIDFDAATRLAHSVPQPRGTVHYMAPERFGNAPPTPASDLYSLGITFYEVVADRLPFDAHTRAEIITAHHLHSFHPLPDHLPAELRSLITQLISREPSKRHVHST